MDAARAELVRAWQLYFGQRGGAGPTLPPDVLPVIVLDDNSAGPYPPYRPWHTGGVDAAVAGQRSAVGVANYDGVALGGGLQTIQPIRSAVVVDFIRYRCEAASDVFVAITNINTNPFEGGSEVTADDAAPEKDPSPLGNPKIGNVMRGTLSQAAQLGSGSMISSDDVGDIFPHDIPGPFVLGPGQILYVQENLLASGLRAWFRGRYYPGG